MIVVELAERREEERRDRPESSWRVGDEEVA
jgi:hypothetical protein